MSGIWTSIKGFFGFKRPELVKKLEQLRTDAAAEHCRQVEEMVNGVQKELLAKIDNVIIPALYKQAEDPRAKKKLRYRLSLIDVSDSVVRKRLEKFMTSELKKRGISFKKVKVDNYYDDGEYYDLCW